MALSDVLARVVQFLRAGYPQGVPAGDYVPLLALLRRRLSEEEVVVVASELMAAGGAPIEGIDLRVAITKITDEMPSVEDAERVTRRLNVVGWPVEDWFGPRA